MVVAYVGRVIGAVAAAVLFLSLFGSWYEVQAPPGVVEVSGWEAFSRQDVLLALLALLALATTLVRPRLIGINVLGPTLTAARILFGLLAGALVVRRLVYVPLEIGEGRIDPRAWAYVALVAAVVVALSGALDWLTRPRRTAEDALL